MKAEQGGEAAFKVVIFGKDIVAKQFSEKIIVEKTLRSSNAKNKTEMKVRMVPERRGSKVGAFYLFTPPQIKGTAPLPSAPSLPTSLPRSASGLTPGWACKEYLLYRGYQVFFTLNLQNKGDIFQLVTPLPHLSSCSHQLFVTREKQILFKSNH